MPETATRPLTFLFTDIEGSTKLWEHEPEAMKAALAEHDAMLRRAITGCGGRVFKTIGDAFYAVFPSARDAVSAALNAQQQVSSHQWAGIGPVRVRMALHTGEVKERDGDFFGPALNRVARILAVGHGGQTLLSQATRDLVADSLSHETALRDLGAHRLRDLHRAEHIYQLLVPGLVADFPSLRSLDALPNNLPRLLTSFVGREREIVDLKRLLAQTALLTIAGAGGAGKTRLALQLAADVLEEFSDGVWLVELAAVTDPAEVPRTVASALTLRAESGRSMIDVLLDYLRSRQALLVLDNCEHLVAVCAALTQDLLKVSPRLRILCTSREALGVAGEVAWRIPALSLPDIHRLPPFERLVEYEAIRLFAERASAVAPTFALDPEHAALVASLCARLDGIPLAIELAAARVKVLTVAQIAARLDDRFRLLTGGSRTALPRQQTLRAAMDWSYDLLSVKERALLRRLSVFSSGWTLETAEAICAGSDVDAGEVLDLQASLVDKSLVVVEDLGPQARYRMLETVRQYGRDKLVEANEAAAWRARHRDWFLTFAEEAEPHLQGPEQALRLERLSAEHENLNTALEWSLSSEETAPALRFVGALWWYWFIRGHLGEGNRWAREAVARSAGRTPLRARVLAGATALAYAAGDYAAAVQYGEEGLALAQELADTLSAAVCVVSLSLCALAKGERDRAVGLAERARAMLPALGSIWGQALVTLALSEVARVLGHWAESLAGFQRSLGQFHAVGDMWGVAQAHRGLGFIARAEGDYERAAALQEEGLALARKLGDKVGVSYALLSLAIGEMQRGRYESAEARMREAVALIRETRDQNGLSIVLYYLGLAISFQGRNDEAERLLNESCDAALAVGAQLNAAYATSGLARVEMHRGNSARTTALASAAQRGFQEVDDRWGVAVAFYILGTAAIMDQAYARALALGEDSLRQFQRLHDGWAAGSAMRLVARASLGLGDHGRARAMYAASLRSARDRGELLGVARGLMGLALVAAQTDEPARAALLLAADEMLRQSIGVPVPDAERPMYARVVGGVKTALGEPGFSQAWASGSALTWQQAAEYALDAESGVPG